MFELFTALRAEWSKWPQHELFASVTLRGKPSAEISNCTTALTSHRLRGGLFFHAFGVARRLRCGKLLAHGGRKNFLRGTGGEVGYAFKLSEKPWQNNCDTGRLRL